MNHPLDEQRFILSFDVEEYFQVESVAAGLSRDQWMSMPMRLEPVVDQILQILSDKKSSATFFILGWVARHQPRIVRTIASSGHEIASHGMTHQMLQFLGPDAFRQELLDSRNLLEDISGLPVRGFRAPTFSITHKTAWALDTLVESGYMYDSSIFPIHHDRYGVPEAPVHPHYAVGPAGGEILEIPPLTWTLRGLNIPVGGGGYLRLLPVRLVEIGLKKALQQQRIPMVYMHPWELDPDQPILPMSWKSRLRHRIGLRTAQNKLNWLLSRHQAIPVGHILPRLQEETQIRFRYGRPG